MESIIRKRWIVVISIISLFCVVVLFFVQFPKKQRVWTIDNWNLRQSDSNTEGNIADGPHINLPPGRYRFQWQIDLDGEAEILFINTNDVKMDPERIIIQDENSWDEVYFEIPDAVHNFCIFVNLVSGSEPDVYSLRLSSPIYNDHIISIAFMVIGAIIWMIKTYTGWASDSKRAFIILAIAVVISSIPVFRDALYSGTDLEFHASRVSNLADGLMALQFPVRISSFFYNRYGALTSVFYPDLFLYPFALLLLLGASITYCMRVLFISVNAITAYLAYKSCSRLFRDKETGLCVSILYVLSSFRLYQSYVLEAVGTIWGMAFVPPFICALLEVLTEDYRKWPLLTLSSFCIFESHLITTVLSACFAFFMLMVFINKLIREPERLFALGKAIILTVFVSMFTLIPLLQQLMSNDYTKPVQFGFSGNSVSLLNIVDGTIGIGLLPLILGSLYLTVKKRSKKNNVLFFSAVLAIYLSSKNFPWSMVERYTGIISTMLQFPSRLWTIGLPLLCFCGGLSAVCYFGKYKNASIFLLIFAVLFLIPSLEYIQGRPESLSFGEGADPYGIIPEYQLIGTRLDETRQRQIIADESVEVTDYRRFATGADIHVKSTDSGNITLPIFAFDQYQVKIDNQELPFTRGNNNRIMFEIPANTDNDVTIRFVEPLLWRFATVVSLFAAAFLIKVVRNIRKLKDG